MKLRMIALSLIVITGLILPGGFSAAQAPVPPAPNEIQMIEKDSGNKVQLDESSLLVLRLDSNPSTGYGWQVEALDQDVLRQVGEIEFQTPSNRVGAPGVQIIRFAGVSKGVADLKLSYRRPWEKDKVLKTFATQVESQGSFKGTYTPPQTLQSKTVNSGTGRSTQALPASFSWCDQGKCTPVKDQGDCGSCWAFGTVGALENNIKIKDNLTKDLSEQYLVSCNSDGYGCDGGWWAHDYHLNKIPSGESAAGAVYEAAFPYQAADVPCNPPHTHNEKITSWAHVGNDSSVPSTDAIKQAIYTYGPVAAAVHVGSAFQAYTSGSVFQTNESGSVNHAIVLVGWNDAAPGYWILRNSWGPTWGESGYMRIKYGTSQVGYAATYVNYGGGSTTPTPTPTKTPTPIPGTEKIVNGGFESGTTPWVEYSSGGYELISTARPHAGSYSVYMGDYNSATEYIYQSVAIPTNGTLKFWWYMTSQEGTSTAYDYMYVRLYNSSGSLVATLRTRSNRDARGAWYQDSISLASYAGQTLRVQFRTTTDSSLPTAFYVDDVSVK